MKRRLPLILAFLFSITSVLSQDILIQDESIDQCAGVFYDSGGASGDHATETTYTFTICPDTDGQYVGLEFDDFDLGDGSTMTIYNGDTVDASQEFGQFTGTDSPDEIKATTESATGCLTIVFEAGDEAAAGWSAEITCNDPDIWVNDYQTTGVYNQCSGNFYDSGGPNGLYTQEPDTPQVYTVCSSDPDLVIEVQFTLFSVAVASDDVLLIYDGDSTNAPLIGEYSSNPGTIMASGSNASGCLTFEWVPDGITSPAPGWVAEITCREPCQSFDFVDLELDPSQPGTNGANYDVAVGEDINFEAFIDFGESGENATYTWNFDDGTVIDDDATVSHAFSNTGFYDVVLTVEDTEGCEYELEFQVNVRFYAVEVDTSYTVPELVEDVLINNDCAQISNITWRSGNAIETDAGIGYFNGNNSSFPMEEGVVLYSGNVNEVPGPETGSQNSGGWSGDPDLDDLIDQIEGPGSSSSNDATLIEFDFLTFADQISFNFLLSSDEYGGFQCSYSDPFGFFLTGEDNVTQNIALVPGTTTPVAVTTVRDNAHNGGCNSVNPQFFDKFFGSTGLPPATAPIDSQGFTRTMTAQAAVTPGETYHIKLVVGDRGDSMLNSAVFLEAGSFNIGDIDLGGDITQTTPEATCLGDFVTLDLELTIIEGVEIQWYQDGTVIPGETGTTLDVTEPGNYMAEFTFDPDGTGTSGCSSSDTVLVEFLPTPVVDGQAPDDLFACSTEGESEIFNLLDQNEQVLNGQDPDEFQITYYEVQQMAEAGINPIQDPENYEVAPDPDCTTLFVRIEGIVEGQVTDCFSVYQFQICVGDINVSEDIIDLFEGDPNADEVAVFDLTENTTLALGELLEEDYTVTYFETQEDAVDNTNVIDNPEEYENVNNNPQEIFVRIESVDNEECLATNGSFFVEALPCVANAVENLAQCGNGVDEVSFDLTQNTAMALGTQDEDDYTVNYFETEQDAIDNVNEITNLTNYELVSGEQEIFLRVDNDLVDECYNTISFTVTVNTIHIGDLTAEVIEECDEDSNGSASFDLTELNGAALDGQDATAYTVSYYESQADADTGMAAAITNPNAYVNQSANPQTIFVRVENNNDPSCYETSSFLIQSFLSGIANTPNPLYICDNGQSTNVIDLTQNTPIVLGAQSLADFNITYYETQAAADANEVGITDPSNYTYLEEDQEIFVRIENIEREECYNLTSFELNVTTVVIGAVDLQQECDNGTPGTAFFDLTENNIAALAGQSPSNYTVDYYASQDDLDNDVVIADYTNYENTSNPQTVYVKVSSYNPQDCFLTTSFDIEATPSAAIFDPSPLMACDSDNDGFYTLFDLSSKDQEITGGNDDVSVSYHLTLSDAENNVDALNSPYSNISAFNQTVYVRALDELNGCVQTTTLELQVYDRPMIETPADLEACDDATADGQTYFDLTSVEEEVLDGLNPADYEITYHNNEADAIAGGNAISGPGGYFSQAPTQQVWIRVEDIVTPAGCYSVEPLTLIVHPLPEPVQPTALESCDDLTSGSDTDELVVFDLTEKEGEITGGDTSLSVIWYATPADFSNGVSIADPQNYTNDLDNAQTIIAEVTDEQGCSATTTLTLIVNPLPSPTPTDELEAYVICDDDNDGFAEFDLSTYEEEIANGEADVEITFYATQANAEGGDPDDELPNLYTNIQVNTQVIYARSTNINTGCYRYVELTLSVTALPDFVETEDGALDLFICDGEDGNNTGIFDLTQNTPLIYGTQSAEDFSVSYYESEADAANAEDPIGNPSAYSNAGVSPLSVWFRIEDEDTGCYRIGSFGLNVGSDPSISNPSKLSVCDDSALAADDEIGLFDLTAAIPEITNNDTSLSVYFYENAAALAADNPIADPENYQNIANAQTLEVRVIGENTCPAHTTLTLEVTPNPSLALELEAIEECDGDNDGFTEFDLEAEIDNILNGEPNVTITFHISENAANLGTNPITNTDVYSTTNIYQTIYVRAENTGPNGNDGTGCYTVRPLELIQIASPEIQLELEDLYVCDDESPNGFTSFDLTQNEDNILGDVDASDLEITYHTNEQEAIDGVNAIAVPTNYTNTSNGQTIYVRLENTTTGCIDTFGFDGDNSFTLNVNELPPLSYPTDLNVCDDDYDNDPYSSTLFDLTVKETEIFGGVPAVPSQYEFTYYANAEDLNNGIAIDTPEGYENIANPQTIYVVVEDTSGTTVQCSAEVSFDLQVLPLPSPSTTDPDVLRQTACDDDNDGVALDPFDLSLSGQLISQGENVTISYYKTLEAAEDEDAAELIGTPTAYLNEPSYNEVDQTGAPTNVQVIYARVDSNATGNFCYVVVPFELVVQPVPVLNEAIDDLAFGYTVCSDDAGGLTGAFYPEDVAGQVYDYNGGDFDTSLIVPLLDQNTPTNGVIEDYTLSFHFSVADALAGENAVPFGYQASNGEQFYIQLTHTLTGCMLTEESDLGILHINVAPRPTIADVDLSRMLCSNNEGEDTATINLQDFDTNIDNNATPPTTEVYYYASEVDYDNGDRIPETAESTYLASDGDVIYAEVINTDTFCTSTNVVMIPITVDARPSVDISDYDQLYICVDSDPSTPVTDGDYSAIIIDTGLDATAYSFEWTYGGTVLAGETGPSITVGGGSSNPLQAGDYSVQVFDLNTLDENNNNCGSDIDTVTILESNPPEFEVAPTSLGFEGEHSLQVFNVSGIGEYEFSIDNGPWVDLSGVTIDFDGLSAGTHIVYGRDKNGCGVTASEVISFIDFPPFFTPNDDGYNDYWNIIGLDTPLNRGAKIFIFDRYGKLLKQLSPSSRGWDGTYNGNPLPSGDYWFSVEYQDPGIPQEDGSLAEPTPNTFKNHFTLKR